MPSVTQPLTPGAGLLGVDLDVASLAAKAIKSVLKVLFGDLAGALGEKTLRVLLTYPDFTEAGNYGHVQAALEQTLPIVLALLAVSTLLGFAHGLATDGQSGGLDAFKRFLFSFVAIWAWGWLFSRCMAGANLFFGAMVDLPMVKQTVGQGIELAMVAGASPLGLIVGPIVSVFVLALLGTKIAATALLGVTFVGGPYALAVFPYPPLAHLTGALFQTLGMVLALPFLWSILLLVFAAFGRGALALDGAGLGDAVSEPLVAMTLLVMMLLALPFLLKRGHAAGLLPSLQGARSMAYYVPSTAPRVGAEELAARSRTQLVEAAAPSSRVGPVDAPAMGFDAPAAGPTSGFAATQSGIADRRDGLPGERLISGGDEQAHKSPGAPSAEGGSRGGETSTGAGESVAGQPIMPSPADRPGQAEDQGGPADHAQAVRGLDAPTLDLSPGTPVEQRDRTPRTPPSHGPTELPIERGSEERDAAATAPGGADPVVADPSGVPDTPVVGGGRDLGSPVAPSEPSPLPPATLDEAPKGDGA